LQSTGTHPSADWIYDHLKRDFPNLSMGTVYRNLSILMDQGLVKKIDFGSTFDRFDANTGPHYHFLCERCGSIADLEMEIDATLDERVNRITPYSVKRHRIEFYGLCDRCQRNAG
jgi:Fur family peroxide stress response transcriptional regulator